MKVPISTRASGQNQPRRLPTSVPMNSQPPSASHTRVHTEISGTTSNSRSRNNTPTVTRAKPKKIGLGGRYSTVAFMGGRLPVARAVAFFFGRLMPDA